MAKIVRYVVFGMFGILVAAFGAMLLEPFFAELLQQFGIDTSVWVTPMLDFLRADFAWSSFLLIAGTAIGVAAHWLATLWDRKQGLSLARPQPVTPMDKLKLVSGEDLRNQAVAIDGKHLRRCDLRGATISYGGDNFQLTDCKVFDASAETKFVFTDRRAVNTIDLKNKLSELSGLEKVSEVTLKLPKS